MISKDQMNDLQAEYKALRETLEVGRAHAKAKTFLDEQAESIAKVQGDYAVLLAKTYEEQPDRELREYQSLLNRISDMRSQLLFHLPNEE